MVRVGVHVSIAGSLDLAVDRAKETGCDVFQMFSRNPRGWGYKPLSDHDCDTYQEKIQGNRNNPCRPYALSPEPGLTKSGYLRKIGCRLSLLNLTGAAGLVSRISLPTSDITLVTALPEVGPGSSVRLIPLLVNLTLRLCCFLRIRQERRTVSAAVSSTSEESWTGLKITPGPVSVLIPVTRLLRGMS